MTRDEIRLVVFILTALLIGVLVQHWRARIPSTPAAEPAPVPHGWAKPPYVLKEKATSRKKTAAPEAEQ